MNLENYDAEDELVRNWKVTVAFILTVLATALTTAGTVMVSPHIAQWAETGTRPKNWTLFGFGVCFMVAGIFIAPFVVRTLEHRAMDSGVNSRFVARVDECIRAMNEYRTEFSQEADEATRSEAKSNMIQKITTEATHILGNDARLCVYRYVTAEMPSEEGSGRGSEGQTFFQLERENPGNRHPHSTAREYFSDKTPSGQAFLDVVAEGARRVVVNDIERPPAYFSLISPNKANGYKSFIVSPIISPRRGSKKGKVIGAITVDFPKAKIIGRELDSAVASITEMFAHAYSEAVWDPFGDGDNKKFKDADFLKDKDVAIVNESEGGSNDHSE